MSSFSSSPSSSPSPTSAPRPTTTASGIVIPTTTVVAIGAGFITFALLLLSLVLFIRFLRLVFRCKKEGKDWRVEWEAQGGTWGWLHRTSPRDPYRDEITSRGGYVGYGYGRGTGLGNGVGWMNSGVGGGGWYGSEMTRMRLWNERVREERGGYGKDEKIWDGEKPELWEVDLDRGARSRDLDRDIDLDDEKDHESDSPLVHHTPIAVGPTNKPDPHAQKPIDLIPKLRVSILIALPSPSTSPSRSQFTDHRQSNSLNTNVKETEMEVEMEMEIPEMVIGSMTLIPTTTIPSSTSIRRQTHNTSLPSPSRSTRRKEGHKTSDLGIGLGLGSKDKAQNVEVKHVEVGDPEPGGVRGVEWVRREDEWVIEGLNDNDVDDNDNEKEKTG